MKFFFKNPQCIGCNSCQSYINKQLYQNQLYMKTTWNHRVKTRLLHIVLTVLWRFQIYRTDITRIVEVYKNHISGRFKRFSWFKTMFSTWKLHHLCFRVIVPQVWPWACFCTMHETKNLHWNLYQTIMWKRVCKCGGCHI